MRAGICFSYVGRRVVRLPVLVKEQTVRQAICHYSFHRRWKAENWTPDRLAAEVKALGVEGVDFHAGLLGASAQAAELIRGAVAKHGLVLSGLSLSNNFNQEQAEKFRAEVETVKEWMRVADELKAPVSRIFGGSLKREQRQDPAARAAGQQRILEGLGEVAREAEKYGLVLALENHGGLPCTAEEQVDVLRRINSPGLKATIDVGNYMSCGQEGHVATRLAAKHCAYVHFKDMKKVADAASPWGWKAEACTLGDGDVDHRACLKALRDVGYTGFVALEYEGSEPEEVGVPRSVAFMKRVM